MSDLNTQQIQQLLENQNSLTRQLESLSEQRRKSDGKKTTEWIVALVAALTFCWAILNHFASSTEDLLEQQHNHQKQLFDYRLKAIEEKLAPLADQRLVDARQDGRLTKLEADFQSIRGNGKLP